MTRTSLPVHERRRGLVVAAALVAGLSAACSGSAPTAMLVAEASADATGDRNKELVHRYLQAEHRGDTAAMAELMTDDFTQYGLGVNSVSTKTQTLESIRHHWEEYKYGGKHYSRIEAVADVTTLAGGRGRPAGEWVYEWGDLAIDYPASPDYGAAKTATFQFHGVYGIRDGKIHAATIYFNHEDIERQLGFLYVSPAEQPRAKAAGLTLK